MRPVRCKALRVRGYWRGWQCGNDATTKVKVLGVEVPYCSVHAGKAHTDKDAWVVEQTRALASAERREKKDRMARGIKGKPGVAK